MKHLKILFNFLVDIIKYIFSFFQDDKGNPSSLRLLLILFIYITFDLLEFWKELLRIEMAKEYNSNIEPLMLFGSTFLLPIIVGTIIKYFQKKVENDTK
jgi:hypothetical protein